jgi:octaprenyl-diphosphate synthase
MLSNAIMRVAKTENLEILCEITQIGFELSDGELAQLANTEKSKITEEEYFAIINKKTAVLFAACCAIGAISAGANAAQVENLKNFGKLLGLCFQIKDDIFDYFPDIEIGKPTGNDLQDGKITLPLIYALAQSAENEREDILSIIAGKNFTPENIEYVMEFARRKGGIDYAKQKMKDIKNEAIALLNIFSDNETKTALALCAEFAVKRKA